MSDYRDELQWLTPRGDHKSEMTRGTARGEEIRMCGTFVHTCTGMAYVHILIEHIVSSHG